MSDALKYCSESLHKAGVDKFQCTLTEKKQYEMNLEGHEFSLIRTSVDNTLKITVIKDNRKGDVSLNRVDPESIDEAILTVVELSNASQQDADYDISPKQESQHFIAGPGEPDADRMYELLKSYSLQTPQIFPQIKLMETTFTFLHTIDHFANSNGVDFVSTKGMYNLSSVFSSKDGEKTSSFNYSSFSMKELERDILDRATLRHLLQQSIEHLDAKPLQGKFIGDIVITPDCLNSFIQYYVYTYLGDRALIAGTSLLKDKLGQEVASPKLTLSSYPVHPEMTDGYFVTPDGFAAENVKLIDKGVLQSFMLSLYAANKTKLARAKNSGDCWVVDPGDKSFDEIIKGVERGILVARYSGGSPSANGDFSGVAKNSYYIENGRIMYPVSETMIAGNLAELFKSIKDISAERVDFGSAILPYVHAGGVTISGK